MANNKAEAISGQDRIYLDKPIIVDRTGIRPVTNNPIAIGFYQVTRGMFFGNFLVYEGSVAVPFVGGQAYEPQKPGCIRAKDFPGSRSLPLELVIVDIRPRSLLVYLSGSDVKVKAKSKKDRISNYDANFGVTVEYQVVDPMKVVLSTTPLAKLWDRVANSMIDVASHSIFNDLGGGDIGQKSIEALLKSAKLHERLGIEVLGVQISSRAMSPMLDTATTALQQSEEDHYLAEIRSFQLGERDTRAQDYRRAQLFKDDDYRRTRELKDEEIHRQIAQDRYHDIEGRKVTLATLVENPEALKTIISERSSNFTAMAKAVDNLMGTGAMDGDEALMLLRELKAGAQSFELTPNPSLTETQALPEMSPVDRAKGELKKLDRPGIVSTLNLTADGEPTISVHGYSGRLYISFTGLQKFPQRAPETAIIVNGRPASYVSSILANWSATYSLVDIFDEAVKALD